MKNLNTLSVFLFVLLMPFLVKSQHFQLVWESPFSPMNVYVTSALLNDAGLQAGDEIGVFDVFQGEEYCVGAIQLTEAIAPGDFAQVICSMDDNTNPGQKNGFQQGNSFIFRYWAHNVEFEDVAFSFPFPDYDENFNLLGTALVDLSLSAEFQSQTINLSPGWNAMSSYLNPLNPLMEDLLSEITDALVIVQNPDGSYFPAGNLNELETWNYESGYFIKLTDSVSLNIIGEELADQEVMLEAGWNLVPVLSDTSILLTELFGENINKVILIKEAIGLNLFWPEKDIATLEELSSGKSYLIKVTEGFELSFSGYPVFTCGDVLTDERDGQEYTTVQIGDQCWMAENLNIGMRIDGSEEMADDGIIEKYCYDNSEGNCDIYGGLYQWEEMMQYITTAGVKGICTEGWHLPTSEEWCTLEQNVDITIICPAWGWRGVDLGIKLQQGGTSGFEALLAGRRTDYSSIFLELGYGANFWTSSDFGLSAGSRRMIINDYTVQASTQKKWFGYSVRCVKD